LTLGWQGDGVGAQTAWQSRSSFQQGQPLIGAIVGGFLFSLFGAGGVTGLNLYSLLVAVIGAICVC
jgi:hypothetical protein